jgi:lipoate-protein ligase B
MIAFERTRVVSFGPERTYEQVLTLQRRLREDRIRGTGPDVLLLGQHHRVITAGRGTRDLPAGLSIPVVEVERGGDLTWHGPGQLVGYPIVDLQELGLGVREYLRELEGALIDALAEHDLPAGRREGATGVWVAAHKIASIGVAVRRHVTCHGFALNVHPDLQEFHRIRPCGFDPQVMTSMQKLLGEELSMGNVTLQVLRALVQRLALAPPIWETLPPEVDVEGGAGKKPSGRE